MNLLKQSDICSMNEEEADALTGQKDIHEAMQVLLSWGLKLVNITMGAQGQWLTTADSGKLIKTTPPKVTVNDTTGAGDATMSGIIYGYLEGKELDEMARIATTMSAKEIMSEGVRIGLPKSIEEIEQFISEHEIPQQIVDFRMEK